MKKLLSAILTILSAVGTALAFAFLSSKKSPVSTDAGVQETINAIQAKADADKEQVQKAAAEDIYKNDTTPEQKREVNQIVADQVDKAMTSAEKYKRVRS